MIEPFDSLAFSIQSHPGVYALLLGSGVSRAAQIPTGWEITLDLARKLAATSGESAEPDPERWYYQKYKEDLNYSKLIDSLAKTKTERQQLLRPYFEPSAQERGENIKLPTAAHIAVAQLVAQGFVKIIITTNFDRLIEKALEDAGVEAVVISSPEQVSGMLPLVHLQHCVIKVNGDYLDARIRNTIDEINKYPKEINNLLDQIFDEFGLVVCGWSADWDIALRKAIVRVPSRRFTTYWAVYGEASAEAQKLIRHRQAQVINIEGADKFLDIICHKVEAIEQFSQPHPLSAKVAVASLKKYISDPKYRIQYSELIGEAVERVINAVPTHDFNASIPLETTEALTMRVRSYEAACSILLSMAAVGGSWAEEDHYAIWRRALERLTVMPAVFGRVNPIAVGLRRYPATLLLYTLGLAALCADNFQFLSRLFSIVIREHEGESRTVPQILPPFCLFGPINVSTNLGLLEGMARHHTPLNDWMQVVLREYLRDIVYSSEQYDLLFDRLEILIALSFAYHEKRPPGFYWAPLGPYIYRNQNKIQILEEIEKSILMLQSESPFVKSGIFGEIPEECITSLNQFKEFADDVARAMWFGRL